MSRQSTYRLRWIARSLCGLAGMIAGLALVGYAVHLPVLFRVSSSLLGMSPLTAAGLISLAVAVMASSWQREPYVRAAASVALAVALAIFGCDVFLGSDMLSPALGSLLFGVPNETVGRTSVATGASLLFLALGAIFRRRNPFTADIASGIALAISASAFLGYLYDVAELYSLSTFNSMTLNTATAVAFLSIAELFAEPERGWASVVGSQEIGGGKTRRHLTFVALPIIAGWLLLGATRRGMVGTGAAMALLVIVTIIPLVIFILRDGRVSNALDRARRDHDEVQSKLTREMERRLAEQAADLQREAAERMKAEAAMHHAQRIEAVGQLTGGIAHDFNNLLMVIRGNLELMDLTLSPAETSPRRYLENSITATEKGAKITGRLLAFSRSQKLQLRPVKIGAVLHSARNLIGYSLGPTINIIMEADPAAIWASTDPDQLELAILNLAMNARDAMPDGGTLHISNGRCHASLGEAAEEDACAYIRVTDNGAGMSAEIAARAIEPFFTTKERSKGTGLGLAQVYGFVRQCGGDLRIVSTLGEGTSVEILLPPAEPPAKPSAIDSILEAARAPIGRLERQVLVVDDDDDVRDVMVDTLFTAGFQVLEAANGAEALYLLNSVNPVVAIIDFLMPGMNGAELARLARQKRPELPIVFVSGYSDTVALDGIAGAVVLRKPFDVRALDQALSSVLN